ncbi:MAG: transporter, partial [Deltaproteobacteria bacterium]
MKRVRNLVLALMALSLLGSSAYGAGFAIIEQSVSGLGAAFSGGAAAATDASTVFFNPAGITRIKGQQVVTGLHFIYPQSDF